MTCVYLQTKLQEWENEREVLKEQLSSAENRVGLICPVKTNCAAICILLIYLIAMQAAYCIFYVNIKIYSLARPFNSIN